MRTMIADNILILLRKVFYTLSVTMRVTIYKALLHNMKLGFFKENKAVRNIFLALTILLGFIFIVSISTFYVSDAIRNNNACGCVIPIPYMILILSSLGLFVGCLVFYLFISKHMHEKKEIDKNVMATLNFLEKDERTMLNELIRNRGELSQSGFEKATGIHKVKVYRVLERLRSKGIIIKDSQGKTNRIVLSEELKRLFL